MKKSKLYSFIGFIFCNIFTSAISEIKILYTAALINQHYEMRKKEYIHCINILNKFGYEPYIVESCANNGPTFFDECLANIFYSRSNNPKLQNKGVNEFKSIELALNYFNFDDDDIILKMTGRYFFNSDFFFKIIKDNPEIDAFIKLYSWNPDPAFCSHSKDGISAFTACFALRCKIFKDMLKQFDFEKLEKEMICIEHEVLKYIRKLENQEAIKVKYIDKIDLSFCAYFNAQYYNPNNITII